MGLLIAILTVYIIAIEYDSEHDHHEYDKRFLVFVILFFIAQCIIHCTVSAVVIEIIEINSKSVIEDDTTVELIDDDGIHEDLLTSQESTEYLQGVNHVVWTQTPSVQIQLYKDLPIPRYRYLSASFFTSCAFLMFEAAFFYFWQPANYDNEEEESCEHKKVRKLKSVKKIITPLDEVNGCIQEYDSDPRYIDETNNGVTVNVTDNPFSWSNISDLEDTPEVMTNLESIRGSKISSMDEIRFRHISKLSKTSAKQSRRRKKKTKVSKEDSDALTLFECETCLYKSQTRENVQRHSMFSHGIVTTKSTDL